MLGGSHSPSGMALSLAASADRCWLSFLSVAASTALQQQHQQQQATGSRQIHHGHALIVCGNVCHRVTRKHHVSYHLKHAQRPRPGPLTLAPGHANSSMRKQHTMKFCCTLLLNWRCIPTVGLQVDYGMHALSSHTTVPDTDEVHPARQSRPTTTSDAATSTAARPLAQVVQPQR